MAKDKRISQYVKENVGIGLTGVASGRPYQPFEQTKSYAKLILAGFILSLSPLAHTHLFLVGVLYIALVLSFKAGFNFILNFKQNRFKFFKQDFLDTIIFALALIPALFALPWLIGK